MEPRLQPVFTREPMAQPGVVVAESQNRVLRNTYWLLALSMLPTIAGAWVGMQMNFVGLFRSAPILSVAAGFRNGGQLVAVAGGMTAAIFFAMAAIATVTKRDFAFLGKFLFVGLVVLIVASLANLFFQVPAVSLTISAVAVLLFSMYLLHDVSRIVRGGETNYITATLNLFLDVYNIFISLLQLLLAFTGQRD